MDFKLTAICIYRVQSLQVKDNTIHTVCRKGINSFFGSEEMQKLSEKKQVVTSR